MVEFNIQDIDGYLHLLEWQHLYESQQLNKQEMKNKEKLLKRIKQTECESEKLKEELKSEEIIRVPECIEFEDGFDNNKIGIIFNNNKQTLVYHNGVYIVRNCRLDDKLLGGYFKLTPISRSELKAGDVACRMEKCKSVPNFDELECYCVILNNNTHVYVSEDEDISVVGLSLGANWYKVERI